ncbi:MAG: cell division protein SepF [Candidatus Pacearchaeota archaeon]
MVFDRLRRAMSSPQTGEAVEEEEYVRLDEDLSQDEEKRRKLKVKLFVLEQYDDVNNILNALREGDTIAMIDFKTLKQRDPVELKRAVSKIKKTINALEGSIAGHENMIIASPSFAKIYKEEKAKGGEKQQNQQKDSLEDY